ncbi:MAG: ComF family protein [Acidobacteria bacterium]|nr:ComF family protein [Acidobacteriota bacterium]
MLDAPLGGPVCRACWSAVRLCTPPFCRTCGDPLPSWRVVSLALEQCARCRRHPPLFHAGRTAGEYEGTLRDILQAFKYDDRRALARPLGALLRAAGADLLRGADCVVPVPLHAWRRLGRGFNQADALARQLGAPVVRALSRTRATPPQTGLTAAARRHNVRGAFRISPLLSRRARARWLAARTVLLVDDVRTTGATLSACAAVLLDAGAREVRILTVARAAPPAAAATRTA